MIHEDRKRRQEFPIKSENFLSDCMVLSSSARLRRTEDGAKGTKEMSLYSQ